MRSTATTVTALMFVLALAACESRPQDGTQAGGEGTMTGGRETGAMAGGDTAAAGDTAAGGQASDITRRQEGMGERMAVPLQAVGGSGVGGEVHLTPTESRTTVIVNLEGTDANARHAAHIHAGTCENIGQVVAPLEPIASTGEQGPTSTTLVDLDAATLTDGNHVVVAHEAGGSPGRPVVCAAIPAGRGQAG